ncbi:hypothetical protein PRZ48_009182 [Zasmidium cellare]|uniref:Uncharacterized protein n=1 Tax=Zasmidium cellare TaxID=395010 RepID=A0ABR0EB25_ZASCE|nr:hypothetical protein PRZ48_009182 [Zasmidium cellare]
MLGVDYVLGSQSLFWNCEHSLCGFESGIFLWRWLQSAGESGTWDDLDADEKGIVSWVLFSIKEALESVSASELGISEDTVLSQLSFPNLGILVLKIWARIFSSSRCWAITQEIGESLRLLAQASTWDAAKAVQDRNVQQQKRPRASEKDADTALASQGNSIVSPAVDEVLGFGTPGHRSASSALDSPLSLTEENVYLLSTYRSGVATWMDVFDKGKTYQEDVTELGTTCPLLLRCICAFTAKHLSLKPSGTVWEPIASRYYVEALNLLIREIDCSAPTANSLTAAILLSSYEVTAALSVPHRSHTKGALDLIRARHVSAASSGSDGKNFRIYVRHELVVALVNESPLQLDPRDWQMPALEPSPAEDELAMHMMWLAGKSINLVFDRDSGTDRTELIDNLQIWYEQCPLTFRGAVYGKMDEEGLQKVFFAVPAAAGKYADSITMRSRSWSLLADIQRELGYHTNEMVKDLKAMVQ